MAFDLNLHRKPSGWVEGRCPFCRKDRKAVLQFNPEGTHFHCFRCGMNGSKLDFEALTGIILNFDFSNYTKQDFMLEEFDFKSEEGVSVCNNERAFTYLKDRGALSYAVLNGWKYIPDKIRIPIIHNNICVGMMDNNLAENRTLKYVFKANSRPSSLFFNFDAAKFKPIIVLVEGVYDAISTHYALPSCGALGLFGKYLSDEKATTLCKLQPEEVVILLDSPEKDKDIERSIKAISAKLKPVMRVSRATLEEGDPNDVSCVEIQKAFHEREIL